MDPGTKDLPILVLGRPSPGSSGSWLAAPVTSRRAQIDGGIRLNAGSRADRLSLIPTGGRSPHGDLLGLTGTDLSHQPAKPSRSIVLPEIGLIKTLLAPPGGGESTFVESPAKSLQQSAFVALLVSLERPRAGHSFVNCPPLTLS